MRRLTVVFCFIYFSTTSYAQNAGQNKTDTLKHSYGQLQSSVSNVTKNPLCIIDGKQLPDSLYKNLFDIINSKDVLSIDVLKSKKAIAKYGVAGKNGVVIIKMKPHPNNIINNLLPESDTIYTNSAKKLVFRNGNKKAYITIDDIPYHGRLETIDTANISGIDILKPVDAVAVFGDKAANGAILIKTKQLPATNAKIPLAPATTSIAMEERKPLYLVDGEIYKGDINQIDQHNIIDIAVLKEATTKDPSESSLADGEVIIATRPYAIAAYQKKLSALSKKYKNYIDLKHNDIKLQYVLDNALLNIQQKSAIEDLYQLPADKIDKIEFKTDSHFTTDATVIITTKE